MRVTPVAQRVDIAHVETVLQPLRDICESAGDLAGDEGLAAARALVVEEDAVAGIHAVSLAIVDANPIGIELGHGVGRARMKRRRLALRCLLHKPVKLGGRGLIETRGLFHPEEADRLEQAQRADGVHVGGVFRRLEAHRHVALRPEVIDLVGLHLAQDAGEVGAVGEIAVMQPEPLMVGVRVLVDVVDPRGVEQRGAALDAVHLIALFQQKLCQIRSVLSGDAGDECLFHGIILPCLNIFTTVAPHEL